jgi:hypothetical protein
MDPQESYSIITSPPAAARIARAELWGKLSRLAKTDQERVVLTDSFVYHLPPHIILTRHRDLFSSQETICAAKRDLLERFQRDGALQELCVGLSPA